MALCGGKKKTDRALYSALKSSCCPSSEMFDSPLALEALAAANMVTEDLVTLHRSATKAEQQLKQLVQSHPTMEEEIQSLRMSIRDMYLRIIVADPSYAARRDLEQNLWKVCFYKRIEEFRKRIRKVAAAVSTADSKANALKARQELHEVCTAFGDFVKEGDEFYQNLMSRFEELQRAQKERKGRRGSSPYAGTSPPEAAAPSSHDFTRSIHRCLIYLGDLARYRELHSESNRKDWSAAERWYYTAIDIMPASGNPHNQLAVLATYTEAECVAVYRYCRALLCEEPFQTARENLSLLFEKNRQSMAEPLRNGETQEDEERLRQGLIAGTITGQQAGIARAALLKSFLQRFVRLHGLLFSGQDEDGGYDSGNVDSAEFLTILDIAQADLRQLLKMSAFGDGLLLHMVIICIFSVIITKPEKELEKLTNEDSVVQSLAISLAMAVASEIASCVRTTRQETEHVAAKPPGSRLLGPVVVFCDWLSTHESLWKLRPAPDHRYSREKDKEAETRLGLWKALTKITSELLMNLPTTVELPEGLVWNPEDGRVLKEQHDLRGFQPLNDVYGYDMMTASKPELGRMEIVSDDLAPSWRTARLAKFLTMMSNKAGVVVLGGAGEPAFMVKGREIMGNGMLQANAASFKPQRKQSAPQIPKAADDVGSRPTREDDLGEEVIVFKPDFFRGGLDWVTATPPPEAPQQSNGNPSGALDDSNSLPKDVVESMLGDLLDCSDSGPRPRYQAPSLYASGQPQAGSFYDPTPSWSNPTPPAPPQPPANPGNNGWSKAAPVRATSSPWNPLTTNTTASTMTATTTIVTTTARRPSGNMSTVVPPPGFSRPGYEANVDAATLPSYLSPFTYVNDKNNPTAANNEPHVVTRNPFVSRVGGDGFGPSGSGPVVNNLHPNMPPPSSSPYLFSETGL